MNKRVLIWMLGLMLVRFSNYAFSPSPGETEIDALRSESTELFRIINPEEMSFEAFDMAYRGFNTLISTDKKINDSILSIIDFSQPSVQKRLYVIDIRNKIVCENTLVAHGMNSGSLYAESFSNDSKSHKSSLGFYLTDRTYEGKHGYSLKLKGIEKGINDNASMRAIVMHGAHYASDDFISKYQRLGRSYGCPALPYNKNREVINLIRNRSCLFIYSPNKTYLKSSVFSRFLPYLKTTQL